MDLTSKLIDGTFPRLSARHPVGQRQGAGAGIQGVRPGGGPRLDHLGRQDARGEAGARQGQGDAVGGQSGKRHGDRRSGRHLQRRAAGDRLQRPLSARHHRPDRGQVGALPAVRRRFAHHHRGHGRSAHALCPHAHAGVMHVDRAIEVARRTSALIAGAMEMRVTLRCERSEPRSARLAVTRVQLTNFRSYAAGELAVERAAGRAGGPERRGQDQYPRRDFAAGAGARPARRQAVGTHPRSGPSRTPARPCGRWRRRLRAARIL